MEDSLMIAKLTLMLLRASIQNPESLPADYRVKILPSPDILSRQEAILAISRLENDQVLVAERSEHFLVISKEPATQADYESLRVTAPIFDDAIHSLNKLNDPNAFVRVVGFHEELVVPENLVRAWLRARWYPNCPMSVGRPLSTEPKAIATLYLGDQGRAGGPFPQ